MYPDSGSRPTETISPVGKGREHAPGLSVCLYGLSICDPACLLRVYSLLQKFYDRPCEKCPRPYGLSVWPLQPVCNFTILSGIS